MRILVVGGSNSLLNDGYVSHLQRSLQGHAEVGIDQISVGATSTLSSIGRLHETFVPGRRYDVILYEYAINDAGHFAGRPDGAASWQLCLCLMIKVAARLYPDAVLVPLVFAMEPHFSMAQAHPFYTMQMSAFASLDLPVIDIRAWLSELFLGHKPDWLYGDTAHYAAPQATGLIGATIATRLLRLLREGAAPLAVTWARLAQLSPFASVEPIYVPGTSLLPYATGAVETGHVENRLMGVNYLRLHAGSRLSMHTEMFPLAFFIKSDAGHDMARLTLSTNDGFQASVDMGTRHADTASYRFIYSSLPVPLLFGDRLAVRFNGAAFTLELPEDGASAAQVRSFDCFGRAPAPALAYHLDVAGILFVVNQ